MFAMNRISSKITLYHSITDERIAIVGRIFRRLYSNTFVNLQRTRLMHTHIGMCAVIDIAYTADTSAMLKIFGKLRELATCFSPITPEIYCYFYSSLKSMWNHMKHFEIQNFILETGSTSILFDLKQFV